MQQPVITMRNVAYTYEKTNVLHHIDFELPRGAFMGVTGPNGGGKTTLIKLMLGLLKPQKGDIQLFGQPIQQFKNWDKIGFVSQKSNAFNKGFPATVYEVVSMGLTSKVGYLKFLTKKHKKKIISAIEQVGMGEFTHRNIGALSGGQQQRVFIARALVSDPELLILDEPTVGVDAENVDRFYDLLNHLNKDNGITMLLVTHDTGTMTEHATDIVCINQTLHFHGKPDDYTSLTAEDLSKFYGYPVKLVTHDHHQKEAHS
ncbi:Fe(3+) ions import ATP-binding protein FbpC [Lentibacillus sp. JNUCC-1]|uniref:metal ABC transporter ATP-binding protein n=1 Tax=Lentibacillus sp. JNUCC-1 TaxID=2654513 RepID=UPI0012E84E59|nr:metal ABC transporter ATP-binding protein [Lentibacillus sp. JNUCC-1]MUV39146.1 Fe(3+) ions import ATP-binding protein FbpC [Lentibacillus sp. JNUCC-1]